MGWEREDKACGSNRPAVLQPGTVRGSAIVVDAGDGRRAFNPSAGLLGRLAHAVDQRLPAAVDVVDGVPERALEPADEDLRADEVQGARVYQGIRGRGQ